MFAIGRIDEGATDSAYRVAVEASAMSFSGASSLNVPMNDPNGIRTRVFRMKT